jgi:dGTPase
VVRLADSVAYLNHDIVDAIRAGLLGEEDLPRRARDVLGAGHSQRINTLVCDIIDASWAASGLVPTEGPPRIQMSEEVGAAANELRDFMFDNVYLWEGAQMEGRQAQRVVRFLYQYYVAQPHEIVSDFVLPSDPPERRAADYVAGMTDQFAMNKAARLGLRV